MGLDALGELFRRRRRPFQTSIIRDDLQIIRLKMIEGSGGLKIDWNKGLGLPECES
jgi:hypothetical protein